MFKVKMDKSNYCDMDYATFKITNYDKRKLIGLKITAKPEMVNQNSISKDNAVIGEIVGYNKKTGQYTCKFYDNLLTEGNISKDDLSRLQISLALALDDFVECKNIDLSDDGVEVHNAFICAPHTNTHTVGVYLDDNQHDKDMILKSLCMKGIGTIYLNDIVDLLASTDNAVDILLIMNSLERCVRCCTEIRIYGTSKEPFGMSKLVSNVIKACSLMHVPYTIIEED